MTLEEQQRIAGKIVLDLKATRSKLACLLKEVDSNPWTDWQQI